MYLKIGNLTTSSVSEGTSAEINCEQTQAVVESHSQLIISDTSTGFVLEVILLIGAKPTASIFNESV